MESSIRITPMRRTVGCEKKTLSIYWDSSNEIWGISCYDDIVEIEKNKAIFINSDKEKGGYRPNLPADSSIIGLDDLSIMFGGYWFLEDSLLVQ